MSAKKRIITAIIGLLILAGCAWFVMDAMGLELVQISSAWTFILIAIGFVSLFSGSGILGSIGLMLLGGGILVRDNGWLNGILAPVSVWQMIAAIIMLIIGLSVLGSALGIRTRKHRHQHHHAHTKACKGDCSGEASAVFCEQCFDYAGQEFSGIEVSGVFGSVQLDLRGAIITSDCTIEANGVFGSAEIITDSNANYVVVGNGVFGSVNDHSSRQHIDGLPTVTIEANPVFGSVEIR